MMNGYGLAAAIVQAIASLSWPIAFVAAVWLFREKFIELLPQLRLKHKDWEVGFRLDKAEKDAAALPDPAPPPEVAPTPEERSRFHQLASISPRAAIMELRAGLEEALISFARRNVADFDHLPGQLRTVGNIVRYLRNKGLIDEHTAAILDDLRAVGNVAAHNSSVAYTENDALRFGDLADQVIRTLNSR